MIGIIFSALFLGFFTGRFFLAPIAKPLLDTILMTALAVMVFCAGADIGSSRQIVRRFLTVKTLGLSLLVLLATNVGSLGGGLIMGYLMGVPFRDALLVSAGMGWYSLSSVLLSAAVGTETGTLAFLANALRELLTILGIPLLARFCHLPLVVVGGATSMDSTMPILLQTPGGDFGLCQWIPSFFGDSPSFCFSALTDSQRFPQSIRSFSYVCHSRFLFLDGIDISFSLP